MSKKSDCPKNQRIQVFARCRPLNTMEKRLGSTSIMEVIPEMNKLVLKDRKTSKEYLFDQVFSPDSEQITVYEAVVGPLIQEVLMGYSCTVFAYGQTGTGKTYTMEGVKNDAKWPWKDDPAAGIIPRSLHQLFEELNQAENVEFSVKVSFFEIYNEEVYDLLSSSDFSKLRLYEDISLKDSVKIRGLEEVLVKTEDEVYTILEKGTAKRHTAETKLNACSSRSHTVFTITVNIIEKRSNEVKVEKTGKLNLVDLAGSENVRRSGAIDKRAREAGSINQSLLTLGRVITALIEKQPHVPYRESKLTRILQYSLGGHAKTSIIATISPALCNLDETIKTLDYAAKAKMIDINPELSRRMLRKGLVKELTEENERLQRENEDLTRDLAAARSSHGFFVNVENHECMIQKITLLEDKIEGLEAENSKLHQKAVLATNDIEELHAKIRRTQTVAYTNEGVCEGLQVISQMQCASLQEMIAGYSKERMWLSKYFKEYQARLNRVMRELEQKNCLRPTLTNELQLLLNGSSVNSNERATSARQWANDLTQDLKSVKDSLVSECEKFLTQALLSLSDDLNAEKAAMEVKIAELMHLCSQIRPSVLPEKIKGWEQRDKSLILLCWEVTDMLEDLQKFQVDNYEKLTAKFKYHNSEALHNIQSKNHKVNNIIRTFSNHIDTEFKNLEEKIAVILDISTHSGSIFEESEKSYSYTASQLQKAISENKLEIEQFISKTFINDVPTGTTPQQRASSLCSSFRNNDQFNTPSKANEESNCSDSSFISSQDISFASDTFDSDGNESYSSVMPDIHYDDEDKENHKEKSKVSNLSRRKSVKFSELPTISESGPLSSYNYLNSEVDRK